MSIYAPKGNFKNEVADSDKLLDEWISAKRIADNATNWQFCSQNVGRILADAHAENGEVVTVVQKHAGGHVGAGTFGKIHHNDGKYLMGESRADTHERAWLIPYLKGWSSIFDDQLEITWTAKHSELVMVGFSFWWYRLSADNALTHLHVSSGGYFDGSVSPRIKVGINMDGTIIDGSGPGCNVSISKRSTVFVNGSREKSVRSVSNTVQLLPAGTHKICPVAAQGPASRLYAGADHSEVDTIGYFSRANGGEDTQTNKGPSVGIAIAQANIHVIRFPRGRLLE
jgi:hypothetical protein